VPFSRNLNEVEVRKGANMETDANSIEAGTVTIGGNIVRIVSLDVEQDTSVLEMVMPPAKGPNYQNTPHKHLSKEPIHVLSGVAEVIHGFDLEHLEKEVLSPGTSGYLHANEWHGVKNLSTEEELVVHIEHAPMGILWAQFIRESIASQSEGRLPTGFVKQWFDRLGLEFQTTHEIL
jgi:quercetin dioxygenase-like cupin family protein